MHHVVPEEKCFNIHNAIVREGIKLSVLKRELLKTIPLCSNHHRLFHNDELSIDEQIMYDISVFIKFDNNSFDDIDNLEFILGNLTPDQQILLEQLYKVKFLFKVLPEEVKNEEIIENDYESNFI